LVDRRLTPAAARELLAGEEARPGLTLDPVAQADLAMLADGAFSPLTGFLEREDYERCLEEMRLAKGHIWPIPISLAANEDELSALGDSSRAVLRD